MVIHEEENFKQDDFIGTFPDITKEDDDNIGLLIISFPNHTFVIHILFPCLNYFFYIQTLINSNNEYL